MPLGDKLIRVTATYTGHVQGVGFRYTTLNVARGYEVTGYVRNLRSGGVEVVAEGTSADVEAFLDALEREMGGYIHDRQRAESPARGEFAEFSLRTSLA